MMNDIQLELLGMALSLPMNVNTQILLKSRLNVLLNQRFYSIRTLAAAKQKDLNRRTITGIVRDHKTEFLATDFIL